MPCTSSGICGIAASLGRASGVGDVPNAMAAAEGTALIDGATALVLGMLAGNSGRTAALEILGAGFS